MVRVIQGAGRATPAGASLVATTNNNASVPILSSLRIGARLLDEAAQPLANYTITSTATDSGSAVYSNTSSTDVGSTARPSCGQGGLYKTTSSVLALPTFTGWQSQAALRLSP